MVKAIRWIGYLWLGAVLIAFVVGVVTTAERQGLAAAMAYLSPFNVIGWITNAVVAAPGIGLLVLAERMGRPASQSKAEGRAS